MKNIAVITTQASDFSSLFENLPGVFIQYIKPDKIKNYNLDLYDAFCILGGTSEELFVFDADDRIEIERQIEQNKKVFCEFCGSINYVYSAPPVSTRFSRLVYVQNENNAETDGYIEYSDILEDQCNLFSAPYSSRNGSKPILIYKEFINSHEKCEISENELNSTGNRGLWFELPNLMLCSFRICNFIKSRFSPMNKWKSLVNFIIGWVIDEKVKLEIGSGYYVNKAISDDFNGELKNCVKKAIGWFDDAGIILDNGKKGVQEGFGTEIYADGTQKRSIYVRNDCTGEAALAFFADFMLTQNKVSLEKSDNLEDFCYRGMQIKAGAFKGMLRWTNTAFFVCYQDDVARVLIPTLLKVLFGGSKKHLDDCKSALDFLVKSTGTDGLRVSRTDNINYLDSGNIEDLNKIPANFPSAHYNSFYLASLILYSKISGESSYGDVGIKGLTSIMSVYPKTTREQSETQEVCRLVLPLACLYYYTKSELHKEWLYRVVGDLQKMKHKSGAYLEWDSDYSANLSLTKYTECSLLTKNGDPVVDMLYSNNWLPLGFTFAFLVTGDEHFYKLFRENAEFMIKSQINSGNKDINGAWARGFDVDLMEIFGLPNDVGWGPSSIESGWTVAEIISGLA
ncbi:MAG: hypothetical protein K0S55_911, partial [Clostridia bacterium]|nr:hypothetical protein [Clostridia bacterium]